MFDGSRGKHFAVVTAIFLISIFVLFTIAIWETSKKYSSVRERNNSNSREYATNAEKDIENRCLVLEPVGKAECIREVIETTNEHYRSERDLIAQTDMALWALWMAVISGLMFIATVIGVLFIWRTLFYTRRTLDEAKATTKAAVQAVEVTERITRDQNRAYISVAKGRIKWWKPSQPVYDAHRCDVKFTISNSGQTPATFIEIGCFATRLTGKLVEVRKFPADVKFTAIAATPGKGTTTYSYSGADIVDVIYDIENNPKAGLGHFEIRGVVRYITIYGEVCESDFAFNGDLISGDRISENIQSSKLHKWQNHRLRLYKEIENGDYSDDQRFY